VGAPRKTSFGVKPVFAHVAALDGGEEGEVPPRDCRRRCESSPFGAPFSALHADRSKPFRQRALDTRNKRKTGMVARGRSMEKIRIACGNRGVGTSPLFAAVRGRLHERKRA